MEEKCAGLSPAEVGAVFRFAFFSHSVFFYHLLSLVEIYHIILAA